VSMALLFKQFVRIRNARLQVLHSTLNLLVALMVLLQFVFFSQYTTALAGEGAASLQVQWSQHGTAAQRWKSEASEPYCNGSADYDYWGSDTGAVRYEGHSCLPMCGLHHSDGQCIVMQETVYQRDTSVLFAITHIQEQVLTSPQSNASALEPGTRNYFVPAMEAMAVELAFFYTMPVLPWYVPDSARQIALNYDTHSSDSDIVTIIVDGSGKHWKQFAVGEKVILTLGELLGLVGSSLDMIRPDLGPNFRGGVQVAEGPPLRLSGGEIDLSIECRDDSARLSGLDGQVCYLLPRMRATRWVNQQLPIEVFGSGAARLRRASGIFLRTKLTAISWKSNINAIFLNFAASATFFQIPHAVLFVIIMWTLGHTSSIYRKFIYRDFNISIEAGSMAMRLMAHAESYQAVTDRGSKRICRNFMSQKFMHILSKRGSMLDREEIEGMAMFCLHTTNQYFKERQRETALMTFLDDTCDGLQSVVSDVMRSFGQRKNPLPDIPLEVDLDRFEAACSSCESISFEDFVKLFDRDHARGKLENFFMPATLRECMEHVAEAVDGQDGNEVSERMIGDSAEAARASSSECCKPDAGNNPAPHEGDAPGPTHPESSVEDMRRRMEAMEKRLSDLEQRVHVGRSCAEPRTPQTADALESCFIDLERGSLEERTRASLRAFDEQMTSLSMTMQRELATLKEELASGLSRMEATLDELDGRITYVQHATVFMPRRRSLDLPRANSTPEALKGKPSVSTQTRIEQHPKDGKSLMLATNGATPRESASNSRGALTLHATLSS